MSPLIGDFGHVTETLVGFPGGSDGKESICNAGVPGSIPGSGRSPGGGHSNPLQYSRLEDPMDRGTWWVTVHGVAKNRTRLKRHTACMYNRFLYVLLWLDSSLLLIDE